ncbi:tRNA lysidine(34) synthetase TilS [Candidatus Gillettellia adelgis]
MKSDQLITHVLNELGMHRQLLLAFSGGLDSTVLLHLLVQLRHQHPELQLRAIYIHHGLHASSDAWANSCQKQCVAWQVPLTIQYVQVDLRCGGIEAAARTARYTVFAKTLKAREVLVTAQHLDDQSETFLLALKRGSGPAGLSSMSMYSSVNNYVLLRPLLSCARIQLEAYAQQHNLFWINDDSNQDTRFDRNFLRRNVLPLLKQRWPHFASAVARSAHLCAVQEQLLEELSAEKLDALLAPDNSLEVKSLFRYSEACRFLLLRHWISRYNVTLPSYLQLQRLWDEVILSRADATPRLQLGSYQIRRFRGRLYLLSLMASLHNIRLNWSRIAPLILPDGLGILISDTGDICLRPPKPEEKVSIRFCARGYVRIVGRTYARPMKKLWQELSIPPWLRKRTPLIYYNDQLIAALNIFICEEGRVLRKEQLWRLHWDKNL